MEKTTLNKTLARVALKLANMQNVEEASLLLIYQICIFWIKVDNR